MLGVDCCPMSAMLRLRLHMSEWAERVNVKGLWSVSTRTGGLVGSASYQGQQLVITGPLLCLGVA